MNGQGHKFGHEIVSEPMFEADSDMILRFFRFSDTNSDMDTDKAMNSDTGMSDSLGHGLGQTSNTRVRSCLTCTRSSKTTIQ